MAARLTIEHDPGLDLAGRVVERRAVRAVARRGSALLLLGTHAGAWKFPGGGVEPGESDEDALRRELDEECGMGLAEVLAPVAEVVEVARPVEDGYDAFRMTSVYLDCRVGAGSGTPRLEEHEARLGLTACWVETGEALAANRAARHFSPRWVARETTVLELLAADLS